MKRHLSNWAMYNGIRLLYSQSWKRSRRAIFFVPAVNSGRLPRNISALKLNIRITQWTSYGQAGFLHCMKTKCQPLMFSGCTFPSIKFTYAKGATNRVASVGDIFFYRAQLTISIRFKVIWVYLLNFHVCRISTGPRLFWRQSPPSLVDSILCKRFRSP